MILSRWWNLKGPCHIDKIFIIWKKYPSWTPHPRQKFHFWPLSPPNQLTFMKLSGQRVLRNRQWVSIMGLRNRQSVSVTGLRNRLSVYVMGLRNRQSSLRISAKLDDISVTETDGLFLRPNTDTQFFSTLWPDNFTNISWPRCEGGQGWNFYLGCGVQEGYFFHIMKILSMWQGPFKFHHRLKIILCNYTCHALC